MREFITHERSYNCVTALVDSQMKRLRAATRRVPNTALFIGAFNGSLALQFCEKHKRVEVRCVEPHPKTFKRLQKNLQKARYAQAYQLAIGATCGKAALYGVGQSASLHIKDVTSAERRVPLITMSELVELVGFRIIDYLRMNCEGGELEAFDDPSFLERVNFAAIALHGKTLNFLSDDAYKRKRKIQETFKSNGFTLIGGFDFFKEERMPVNHVWQVWTRKKFIK